jgi:hypothetical protein
VGLGATGVQPWAFDTFNGEEKENFGFFVGSTSVIIKIKVTAKH